MVPGCMSLRTMAMCVATLLACTISTMADPATIEAPALTQFTVMESKRVREGNHTVTYNRVSPPQMPVTSGPSATAPTSASSTVPVQTQGRIQVQQQNLVNVIVSATVYNHLVSQISWTLNGATYHGYSNIDFTILSGITQFTSGNTVYSLMVLAMPVAANPKAPAPAVPSISGLPAQTPTQSAYVVDSQSEQTPPPDALTVMDVLHTYFDANRAAIIAAHDQHVAQPAGTKSLPAVPQNVIINYWPIKSQVYGDSRNQ
jgi:hypothetical protein